MFSGGTNSGVSAGAASLPPVAHQLHSPGKTSLHVFGRHQFRRVGWGGFSPARCPSITFPRKNKSTCFREAPIQACRLGRLLSRPLPINYIPQEKQVYMFSGGTNSGVSAGAVSLPPVAHQ